MVSVLAIYMFIQFLIFFLMETSDIGKDVKNIRIAHGPLQSSNPTQLPRLHPTHSPSSQCSGANPTQRTFQRLVSTGAKEKPKQKGTKAWSLASSALGTVQEPSRRALQGPTAPPFLGALTGMRSPLPSPSAQSYLWNSESPGATASYHPERTVIPPSVPSVPVTPTVPLNELTSWYYLIFPCLMLHY